MCSDIYQVYYVSRSYELRNISYDDGERLEVLGEFEEDHKEDDAAAHEGEDTGDAYEVQRAVCVEAVVALVTREEEHRDGGQDGGQHRQSLQRVIMSSSTV